MKEEYIVATKDFQHTKRELAKCIQPILLKNCHNFQTLCKNFFQSFQLGLHESFV